MKTYKVLLIEKDFYETIVTAKNKPDAIEKAHQNFTDGDVRETGYNLIETEAVTQIKMCASGHEQDADGRCACTNKDAN